MSFNTSNIVSIPFIVMPSTEEMPASYSFALGTYKIFFSRLSAANSFSLIDPTEPTSPFSLIVPVTARWSGILNFKATLKIPMANAQPAEPS